MWLELYLTLKDLKDTTIKTTDTTHVVNGKDNFKMSSIIDYNRGGEWSKRDWCFSLLARDFFTF